MFTEKAEQHQKYSFEILLEQKLILSLQKDFKFYDNYFKCKMLMRSFIKKKWNTNQKIIYW